MEQNEGFIGEANPKHIRMVLENLIKKIDADKMPKTLLIAYVVSDDGDTSKVLSVMTGNIFKIGELALSIAMKIRDIIVKGDK